MTRYQNVETAAFGLSADQVRPLLPDLSFADGSDLTEWGFAPYEETAQPEAEWNETVTEADPVDGVQQWAIGPSDLSLPDLKALRNGVVAAKREAVFAAGFTLPSGPLAGKTLQVRDERDKINWLTSQASYSAAVAAGQGAAPGAMFRTIDNENITLTYAQGLKVIVQDMALWGQQIMKRSWDLKDLVDAAPDAEAVGAIDIETGWP